MKKQELIDYTQKLLGTRVKLEGRMSTRVFEGRSDRLETSLKAFCGALATSSLLNPSSLSVQVTTGGSFGFFQETAMKGGNGMVRCEDAWTFIYNGISQLPEHLKRHYREQLHGAFSSDPTYPVEFQSLWMEVFSEARIDGSLRFSKFNDFIEERFVVTPDAARELYKRASQTPQAAEMIGLDNVRAPNKFSKALEILGITAKEIGFNGNDGYVVTMSATMRSQLYAIAYPSSSLSQTPSAGLY